MRTSDLHVVLGATGGIGAAVTAELDRRGHRVRAVSRSAPAPGALPAGVEHVAADVADPDGARRAVAGAAVVLHAAQPPLHCWLEDFEPLTATVADAAARAGARLVFADNLYMYGPSPAPLTELSPLRPAGPKGRMRARMASDLLARDAAGELAVSIGRAPDYYGPGGRGSALGEALFPAALAGRTVRWPGELDVPHSAAYLPDLARGLAVLAEHPKAGGRVWHLPAGPALTGRQFARHLERALEVPVRLAGIGAVGYWAASRFVPVLRELSETRYQWTAPFVTDSRAFETELGPIELTPADEALAATVAWWRAQPAAGRPSTPAAA